MSLLLKGKTGNESFVTALVPPHNPSKQCSIWRGNTMFIMLLCWVSLLWKLRRTDRALNFHFERSAHFLPSLPDESPHHPLSSLVSSIGCHPLDLPLDSSSASWSCLSLSTVQVIQHFVSGRLRACQQNNCIHDVTRLVCWDAGLGTHLKLVY